MLCNQYLLLTKAGLAGLIKKRLEEGELTSICSLGDLKSAIVVFMLVEMESSSYQL